MKQSWASMMWHPNTKTEHVDYVPISMTVTQLDIVIPSIDRACCPVIPSIDSHTQSYLVLIEHAVQSYLVLIVIPSHT